MDSITPPHVLRYEDFSLEPEREALRDAYRSFLTKRCGSERVRAAEPLGFDSELWTELGQQLRPVALGLPEEVGGDGGGLVELALACEELGRVAAPVPLVDTAVCARLLSRISAPDAENGLGKILNGEVASVAIASDGQKGSSHLVGAGAVAKIVLGMRSGELVLAESEPPGAVLANLANAPLGWRDLCDGCVLASGAEAAALWSLTRRDWDLMMAATLVGLGDAALALGVEYAKERTAFGAPIGSFQAIAHPLVDATIGITGARRLVWKASWFADNEPEEVKALAAMARVYAAESAEKAGLVALHTQGGFGFTLESDVQLYYRRAKGWPLLAGDRTRELLRIADQLYGPVAN